MHDADGRPPGERIEAVALALAADPRATAHVRLPAREGVRAEWPSWLDPRVRAAYQRRGIERPWRHQALTAELAHSGEHVVVSTGTASGKSAAFGMPALTAALSPPPPTGGRGPGVLYLAPTKALAHDQLAGLAALGLPELRAGALDGDSSEDERAWARAHARWLVTNPDMLHRSVLPAHERWRSYLRALRYVVLDEAHVYRGVFGAHVALVLRRLRRICALHGGDPVFIAASATAADPGATARALLGLPVVVVDRDDSARGALDLVLWRPAPPEVADGEHGGRPGPAHVDQLSTVPAIGPHDPSKDDEHHARHEGAPASAGAGAPPAPGMFDAAATVTHDLIAAGASTLTFARSRRAVEVIAGRVRQRPAIGSLVRAYRGGYLPEERRALEAALRTGELKGLVSTNALELGIDISGLDAVVLAGWPGRISSFWQQVGRAGRTQGAAVALLLAREDPLDVFVAEHPEVITDRALEATAFDPGNAYVMAGHLCAAAAEAALLDARDDVHRWFGPEAGTLCQSLADSGMLRRRRDGWYWTRPERPADLVDLRGSGGGPVRVVEHATGRLLGTVDPHAAPASVHAGALYVHQGAVYEVLDLDLDLRVATACPTVTDLSTHARSIADVTFDQVERQWSWRDVRLATGQVEVSRQVTGYLVRRWPSGEVLAEHALDLPPTRLRTRAVWWEIPHAMTLGVGIDESALPGALHALEHAAIGVLPLLASCDRGDLGGVSTALHPQTGTALIVVHDGQPGGCGFAARGAQKAREWLSITRDVLNRCGCTHGCPACVQSPKCGNGNEPLDKAAALVLVEQLLACAVDEREAVTALQDSVA